MTSSRCVIATTFQVACVPVSCLATDPAGYLNHQLVSLQASVRLKGKMVLAIMSGTENESIDQVVSITCL